MRFDKRVIQFAAGVGFMTTSLNVVQAQITTDQLLDTLQHTAFTFFWNESNPSNGLIKDRSASGAPCSIASVGFGLSALCIGVDHGWVTREAARDQVLTALRTFWNAPQGSGPSGYIGYKGFFYHFLDMNTGVRTWESELSTIDSALLFAGILDVKQYFTGSDSTETLLRALADSIYRRADWEWFRNFNPGLLMEWKPETQFSRNQWTGYNEAMVMYVLGYGSPTHPITDQYAWQAWTGEYTFGSYYGYAHVQFAPLFGHQYSHCWIDFRNIKDAYMTQRGFDYFENSRRATLAQRAYCAANPGGWSGYSDSLWGITACDGPGGYRARGAPGPGSYDDGTIAPTAAISSIPFAPEVVIPTVHNMWNTYRSQLWTAYGFRDAFNLTRNWWGPDVIGIDQGPIIIMIENYRTGKVWQRFMQNADIRRGLERIGFTPITSVHDHSSQPGPFALFQNYPNPFNSSTIISFEISRPEQVTLKVLDVLGREVVTLVDQWEDGGLHTIRWEPGSLPSAVYFCYLRSITQSETKKMIFMR